MGFDAEGREYPYDDEGAGGMVMGHPHKDVALVVVPMIFNDRLCVMRRAEYGTGYTAGFCYDKGAGAALAGMVWSASWATEQLPQGFKKEAYNAMADYKETARD